MHVVSAGWARRALRSHHCEVSRCLELAKRVTRRADTYSMSGHPIFTKREVQRCFVVSLYDGPEHVDARLFHACCVT